MGWCRSVARRREATSKPSVSGSMTSRTMRSGSVRWTMSSALAPSPATSTSNPAKRREVARSSRMLGSSSTTSSSGLGSVEAGGVFTPTSVRPESGHHLTVDWAPSRIVSGQRVGCGDITKGVWRPLRPCLGAPDLFRYEGKTTGGEDRPERICARNRVVGVTGGRGGGRSEGSARCSPRGRKTVRNTRIMASAATATLALTLAACGVTDGSGDGGDGEGSGKLEELQDAGSITVGFAGEQPYSFEEDGELDGATIALHEEIFANLGIDEVEGVQTEFGSLIPGLNAGDFDVVSAGMSILPERCEQASFGDPE